MSVIIPNPDYSPGICQYGQGVQLFYSHPALTQAFTSHIYSQNLEDVGKQGNVLYEDELQSGNNKVLNHHRNKRENTNSTNSQTDVQLSPVRDDSDMEMEVTSEEINNTPSPTSTNEDNQEDITGMSQHFFPSFAPLFPPPPPPLGHSRPLLFQEQAHSHRPPILRPQHNVFQPIGFGGPFRENKYVQAPAATQNTKSNGILGSGNFGVIRGGTFYDDERGEVNEYGSGENHNVYSPFYHNGHGRPAFYNGASNPRPQHHRGNDFFANFRDFADINTPTKSSYSEFYVVYVNRNATNPNTHNNHVTERAKPKNINEQLTIIDQEKHTVPIESNSASTATEEKILKKLSVGKRKLIQLQKGKLKKQKNKIPTSALKDLHEPLIALS
ncbi:Uncharacterized protein GBIM_17779 [Gryllus bimaculatus]|nr:Uncharacterized protein GBIM_17779 [Gryllus bimaculatus]